MRRIFATDVTPVVFVRHRIRSFVVGIGHIGALPVVGSACERETVDVIAQATAASDVAAAAALLLLLLVLLLLLLLLLVGTVDSEYDGVIDYK
jgi:hypothetical protein